jgi:hypothetical protein
MSVFGGSGLFTRKASETKEGIIRQLLSAGDDVETKTEIPNVLAMSSLDLLAAHAAPFDVQQKIFKSDRPRSSTKDILLRKYVAHLLWRIRVNYISHERASRKEAVTSLQGVEFQEEKEERRKRSLFGE